jgi:hypothetical protein
MLSFRSLDGRTERIGLAAIDDVRYSPCSTRVSFRCSSAISRSFCSNSAAYYRPSSSISV